MPRCIGWRRTLRTSMKPGDLRVGLSYTWMGDKTPFMIFEVRDNKYTVQPIVLILLSNGRISNDTYDYIKNHTVPIEKKL